MSGAILVGLLTTVAAAADTVETLRREGRSAFARGLLPVADFLDQQAVSQEYRLRRLPKSHDARVVSAALQPRLQDLRDAVRAMTEFQQPAAADWAADLALLKYTLARAEADAATVSGQPSAARASSRAEANWAWEHYRRRIFDDRVLGHASLPQVLDAVALLNVSPAVEWTLRESAVTTTQQWALHGSGIGRSDRLLTAELHLVRFGTRPSGTTPTEPEMQAYVDADALAAKLFDGEMEFYRYGTASLADVARAWRLRQTIHDQAQEARFAMRFASKPAMEADLRRLTALAQQTTDRRGRIAGDVLYVQLLAESQELWSAR